MLRVRVSPEQKALLERAAAADDRDLATWIRRVAVREAERVLATETPGRKRPRRE